MEAGRGGGGGGEGGGAGAGAGVGAGEAVLKAGAGAGAGLARHTREAIEAAVSKLKVKVTHLGFWKVIKKLGPAANSPDSAFMHEGKSYTVEGYFAFKATTDPRYKKLKYPFLPTVNMGSATKKELYPAEFVMVPPGQPRNRMVTSDPTVAAELIKYAAVKPQERMNHITNKASSVVQMMRSDDTARAFGLSNISTTPVAVSATVLPPAVLLYGGGAEVRPGHSGTWNTDYPRRLPFLRPPPNPRNGPYMYGVLLVGFGPRAVLTGSRRWGSSAAHWRPSRFSLGCGWCREGGLSSATTIPPH